MGTIVKVSGADYSANPVGKFDTFCNSVRLKDGQYFDEKFYLKSTQTSVAKIETFNCGFDGTKSIKVNIRFAMANRSIGSSYGCLFRLNSEEGFSIGLRTNGTDIYAFLTNQQNWIQTSAIISSYSPATLDIPNLKINGDVYEVSIFLTSSNSVYTIDKIVVNDIEKSFITTTGSYSTYLSTSFLTLGCGETSSANATFSTPAISVFAVFANDVPTLVYNMLGNNDTDRVTDKILGKTIVDEGHRLLQLTD